MRWSFRTNGNFIDFVHTDETSLAVESTIVSLHNTSRAVSWSLPEDTTRISFTIDEVKYSNILITDIDFDGTGMNSQDDFEAGIEAMFPGLAGGGAASYLVYTVSVTQTGTGQLTVVNEFQNTIGTITINRNSVGYFTIGSAGLFTVNKTWIPNTEGNGYAVYPISSSAANAEFYYLKIADASTIELQFFNATFNNVDPSTLFGNGFTLYLPDIRVYP